MQTNLRKSSRISTDAAATNPTLKLIAHCLDTFLQMLLCLSKSKDVHLALNDYLLLACELRHHYKIAVMANGISAGHPPDRIAFIVSNIHS